MRSIFKRAIKFTGSFCLAGFFLYLMIEYFLVIDFKEAFWKISTTPFLLLFLFFGYFLSFLFKAAAWRRYFQRKIRLNTALYGIFYSLLINHLSPIKIGDLVRTFVLSKREPTVRMDESFHSVFLLRIMDMICLFLLTLIGMWVSILDFSINIFILVFLFVIGMFAVLLVKKYFVSFYQRHINLFLNSFKGWNGVVIFILTLISWIFEAIILYGIASALKNPLTYFQAVGVNSVTIIGQIFQFTPGGLATYESVMAYSLSTLNIDMEDALLIALFSHGFKFVFSYLVGIWTIVRYPLNWIEIKNGIQRKGAR